MTEPTPPPKVLLDLSKLKEQPTQLTLFQWVTLGYALTLTIVVLAMAMILVSLSPKAVNR